MGSRGLQYAGAGHYQEADVLIGVAMCSVRPHGPQPHEGEGDHPHFLSQPFGERVYVTCEGCCIFQRPLGRFTELVAFTRGRILLPFALGWSLYFPTTSLSRLVAASPFRCSRVARQLPFWSCGML